MGIFKYRYCFRSARLVLGLSSLLSLSATGQSTTDSLLNLLKTEPRKKHATILNEAASIRFENEQYRESALLAHQALDLSKEFGNKEEKFKAFLNIAYIHFDLGEIDTSIYYAKEAYALAKESGNVSSLARVCNHLGSTYQKITAFDKSIHYYLQSLQIIEDTLPGVSIEKNQYYKSLVINNIGTAYKNLGQAEKSLEYYKKSLAIRRELGDSSGIATCLQNIGVYYDDAGLYDSTFRFYNEALVIRRSLNQKGYAAELLMNLGRAYSKTGEYKLSEMYLKDAVLILESLDKKRLLAYAYLSMAELYLLINLREKAFGFIEKGKSIAVRYKLKDYEKHAFTLLAEYYLLHHDYKKVVECREMEMALTDSINNSEMTAKVAEVQSKYEIDRMEKEIEILSKDNEIQSLKIRSKTAQVYILIIVVVLVGLLLILVLLLLNRRNLKQKQMKTDLEKSKLLESKLKEENEYQSRQLTTHALNMLKKNKLLNELDLELKAFSPSDHSELDRKISNFRRQINRNMNSEKDWNLFKLYFEEVNKDFFSTLQRKCSDLTTGDLKLAALIKLNMNIKEASAVLNVSPDSLKKARYRLRRKFGLNERENLSDFLNKI